MSIHASDAPSQPPQIRTICPTCGLAPESAVKTRDGSVVTATCLCHAAHLWLVKWTER